MLSDIATLFESKVVTKTCATCNSRKGETCSISRFTCWIERKYPTVCGLHFERWTPRPSFLRRLANYFENL